MTELTPLLVISILIALVPAAAPAQEPTSGPKRWPIELTPDDKPAYPPPPRGFDKTREDMPHGETKTIEYDSKTVGTRRKLLVYTPPGYSLDKKYPTLYLLHGIGGDETEWQRFCAPAAILDNLYSAGKLAPMIVVYPNGRAQTNDRAEGDVFKHQHAFEVFTDELLKDVVPFIESKYPVLRDADHRALAGFSMGGGQSLNIGIGRPGQFAWVGAFSPAPNMREPDQLVPDLTRPPKLKLLYLACGNKDNLFRVGQHLHQFLRDHEIAHAWQVNTGGHNGETWKLDLYHFASLLFKP